MFECLFVYFRGSVRFGLFFDSGKNGTNSSEKGKKKEKKRKNPSHFIGKRSERPPSKAGLGFLKILKILEMNSPGSVLLLLFFFPLLQQPNSHSKELHLEKYFVKQKSRKAEKQKIDLH